MAHPGATEDPALKRRAILGTPLRGYQHNTGILRPRV
jgi:hypothetical protein